jgi:hypothetical protein
LLIKEGLRAPEARELVKPARDLVNDNLFWSYQGDGLAVFLSQSYNSVNKLPFHFDEMVTVSDRFHLKPLMPLLSGNGDFYILALSQKQVRLFKASNFDAGEIALEGFPKSIDETLKYDVFQKQTSSHGRLSGAGERRPSGIMHSHGGEEDPKEELARFCRDVDRGLHPILANEQAPLLVACVDYLFPLYKGVNTYPHLVDASIQGNPDERPPADLHAAGREILEPLFRSGEVKASKKYTELAGTGKTEKDLKLVVEAAVSGRIDTLFVALGVQRWGIYHPDTSEVEVHTERQPGDEDLLDFAAIQTFLHGGKVHAVDTELVPDDRSVAAILRY